MATRLIAIALPLDFSARWHREFYLIDCAGF
jgi:hypothetical protein